MFTRDNFLFNLIAMNVSHRWKQISITGDVSVFTVLHGKP